MSELVQHMARVSTVDCGQGNPDISGIGVRLSFYLQTFLLVLLVDRSWEDAPGALWTFIATSFGLTIAAILQAKRGQLSFFQALQVANLVWLANFGSFLSVASYSRYRAKREESEKQGVQAITPPSSPKDDHVATMEYASSPPSSPQPDNLVKRGVTFQILFSMALTLITWARPSIFSNDSDEGSCDVKYVAFFAKEFPAHESGRILGLVVTSILLFAYLGITLHELKSDYLRRRQKEKKRERRARALTDVECPANGSGSRKAKRGGRGRKASGIKKGRRRMRTREFTSGLDPMLLGITIIQAVVFTYFIVCTELLLKRNPDSDNANKEWGFGQILALIAVVPSLISVLRAFQEHGFRDLHARSKTANSVSSV